jgi:hypothetical protein
LGRFHSIIDGIETILGEPTADRTADIINKAVKQEVLEEIQIIYPSFNFRRRIPSGSTATALPL